VSKLDSLKITIAYVTDTGMSSKETWTTPANAQTAVQRLTSPEAADMLRPLYAVRAEVNRLIALEEEAHELEKTNAQKKSPV
jgi:hypothetical protein